LLLPNWTFLASHGRVLPCIAHDPGALLRDVAASLGITERSTYSIVTDLAEAGYIVRHKTAAAAATRSRHTCPRPAVVFIHPVEGIPPSARTSSSTPRAAASLVLHDGCLQIAGFDDLFS